MKKVRLRKALPESKDDAQNSDESLNSDVDDRPCRHIAQLPTQNQESS